MLCKYCAARYNLPEGNKECIICSGLMEWLNNVEFPKPLFSAKIAGFSTLISKVRLIREEDYLTMAKKSLKTEVNELVRKKLIKMGFTIDNNNAEVFYEIDFENKKINLRGGDIFIFGRYYKLEPYFSQKRWRKKKFYSVEEIIGESLAKMFKAAEYYMHASGREDVDATNEAGRPFVLELKNISAIAEIPARVGNDKIYAELYGRVTRGFTELVANSHFDKCYRAYYEGEIREKEAKILEEFFAGIEIRQFTPRRVEKRRAKRWRKRFIYWMKVNTKQRYIDVCAEAGTYIKELLSGDNGRTTPSVSEILQKEIFCKKLIVTKIEDTFLDHVFPFYRVG